LTVLRTIKAKLKAKGTDPTEDPIYDSHRSLIISAILAKNSLDEADCEFDMFDRSELMIERLYDLNKYYQEVVGEDPPVFFTFKEVRIYPTKVSA
jgi:hypothetical protein